MSLSDQKKARENRASRGALHPLAPVGAVDPPPLFLTGCIFAHGQRIISQLVDINLVNIVKIKGEEMIIPVNDKYRISSSPHSWDIQQYVPTKNPNFSDWKPVHYYASLQQAVNCLHDLQLRESELEGVDACIAESKRITQELIKALTPSFEVRLAQSAVMEGLE